MIIIIIIMIIIIIIIYNDNDNDNDNNNDNNERWMGSDLLEVLHCIFFLQESKTLFIFIPCFV